MATCMPGVEYKKKKFCYLILLLNVKFKICHHIQKNNWCHDVQPVMFFRCNSTNQQTCQGQQYYFYLYVTYSRNKTKEDVLSKCTVLTLLLFPTNYMCEADFSRYVATNSKYHSRLDVAPDMRIHVVYNHTQLNNSVRRKKKKTVHHTSNL